MTQGTKEQTRRYVADYHTDYWQSHALATLLGRMLSAEQRGQVWDDFVAAAQELRAAMDAGFKGPDTEAELRCRYNVLLQCCYGAGYTRDDVNPHIPANGWV
jgi:hypothetical protein